ncbi:MAG: CidA/LrgA family protein [Clostridium sp.]
MKLFREGIIIVGIYLLGELISATLNLPIPGNILGMMILLIALILRLIRVEQIENIVKFFLSHLAFFFIPAGVGLMTSLNIIRDTGTSVLIICVITTIIVIGVTGKVVEFIINKKRKEVRNDSN